MSFVSPVSPGQSLGQNLAEIITQAGIWTPRSKQVVIGPSEMGHECTRRLAYKLLDWDNPNESGSSNWSAQVGSAIHKYLADVFARIEGYEVEQKVTIRGNLSGTVDLYDVNRGIVIDWKTTSPAQMDRKRKEGGSPIYQTQIQLYGYGKAQTGAAVNILPASMWAQIPMFRVRSRGYSRLGELGFDMGPEKREGDEKRVGND